MGPTWGGGYQQHTSSRLTVHFLNSVSSTPVLRPIWNPRVSTQKALTPLQIRVSVVCTTAHCTGLDCLKLKILFVLNYQMYLSQIAKCICVHFKFVCQLYVQLPTAPGGTS